VTEVSAGHTSVSSLNSSDFPPVNEPAPHLAVAIAGHDTARLKSERVQGRVHGAMEAHAAAQPVKSDGVTLLPDALELTGYQLRAKALLVRPADLRPLDRVESDGEAHHLALDGFATRLGAVRVIELGLGFGLGLGLGLGLELEIGWGQGLD